MKWVAILRFLKQRILSDFKSKFYFLSIILGLVILDGEILESIGLQITYATLTAIVLLLPRNSDSGKK
jgi:uncharacterized membrane protein